MGARLERLRAIRQASQAPEVGTLRSRTSGSGPHQGTVLSTRQALGPIGTNVANDTRSLYSERWADDHTPSNDWLTLSDFHCDVSLEDDEERLAILTVEGGLPESCAIALVELQNNPIFRFLTEGQRIAILDEVIQKIEHAIYLGNT